ncbi:MAG: OmpW family outer membrane protein [Ginsengibacter sp.]
MKKRLSIVTALLCIFSLSMQAQDGDNGDRVFKKFKVDVSFGYAVPEKSQGAGRNAGVLFAIEPKYAVIDQLSVGLRIEGAAMVNVDQAGQTGNAQVNASYLATGDYYFSNNKFRPFVGAGLGIFTFANVSADNNYSSVNDIPTTSGFGAMARAGFEYGHLRLGVEYNFVKDKSGYLGLKLGVALGGGRK